MEGKFKAIDAQIYTLVGRRTYLRIDLNVLDKNLAILRRQCSPQTDIIAVVKGNAYGHGSVEISRYLESRGVGHFAVAIPEEGAQLRQAGIKGHIQVFGNAVEEDIPILVKYRLTPTVAELNFLQEWSRTVTSAMNTRNGSQARKRHQLVLKIDTGMSRNGCQTQDFPSLIQYCLENDLDVHSVMTHFNQGWDNPDFTKHQFNTFMSLTEPYRKHGLKLHVASSSGIAHGYGTDLDFIRFGTLLYGLPPDGSIENTELVESQGLRPVLSWRARPTLIKQLPQGRVVGYDNTYMTHGKETIATFGLGFGDGFSVLHSGKCVVSLEKDGVQCPVVGKVSMDAITSRLDGPRPSSTTFNIIADDFTSPNSVTQMAAKLRTVTGQVTANLAARLPRVFVFDGLIAAVTKL
ncbi:alanine racemase-like [Haliotis rufescens]|uniref:alanine racemase-like n=1 Tax=Haliotis rufescens TaxID=6454 RepID=UPI00201F7172|nr:alanine racemase-like [Haliotis rufescens]